jgi:hypothetical protein
MSPLVKTKRQANFKDFKRFGARRTKKRCIQLVRVPIYTRTRQINDCFFTVFTVKNSLML